VVERTIDFISLLVIMIFMLFVDGSRLGPFLVQDVYNPLKQKICRHFRIYLDLLVSNIRAWIPDTSDTLPVAA
jgi:hypothetical protein